MYNRLSARGVEPVRTPREFTDSLYMLQLIGGTRRRFLVVSDRLREAGLQREKAAHAAYATNHWAQ